MQRQTAMLASRDRLDGLGRAVISTSRQLKKRRDKPGALRPMSVPTPRANYPRSHFQRTP